MVILYIMLRKKQFKGKGRRVVKKRGTKKAKVSLAVKSYVKKTIHGAIENKCVQISGGFDFGNVLESPDFNAYPMNPLNLYWTIPQGVGQGSRIGNIIKVRKVYLNYILRPRVQDAITNPNPQPNHVVMFLGTVKNTPSFAPIAGDIQQLYQSGNTTTAPVGNLRDIISVYNKDFWTIKKSWQHKVGYASATGNGAQPNSQFYANNDFKMNVVKRMDITKHCPATCQFNDASATTNTKNLFLMFYCVSANGGINPALVAPTSIDFWVDFHYEDA